MKRTYLSLLFLCLTFTFIQANALIDSTDLLICCYTENGILVSDISYETIPPSNIVIDDCFDLTDVEYPITVTPSKDNNHLNGVSTFDLILMMQHILGVKELDSPYKMIAADVNNDGKITTVDLIQTRQLILQVIPTLLDNTSWRFIPADYQFPDPMNPWGSEFPEYSYELEIPVSRFDYIAVKIGDVNASAIPE